MPLDNRSNSDSKLNESLLERAVAGESFATLKLFEIHHERLKRMVALRLNARVRGRVDEDDVLQEAYIDVARRLGEYQADPKLPFFLWLRHMVGLKLAEVHRQHLGTQKRDAGRELSLHRGIPEASSASLACILAGSLTSPTRAAVRAENTIAIQQALNSLDDIDREVLALKHFEQMSTQEIADLLGMSKAGAGSRYLRAIKRLKAIVSEHPGFDGF